MGLSMHHSQIVLASVNPENGQMQIITMLPIPKAHAPIKIAFYMHREAFRGIFAFILQSQLLLFSEYLFFHNI